MLVGFALCEYHSFLAFKAIPTYSAWLPKLEKFSVLISPHRTSSWRLHDKTR